MSSCSVRVRCMKTMQGTLACRNSLSSARSNPCSCRTDLHAGLGIVTRMHWSPDGAYLLTGGSDESFRLWETQKWTSQAWATHVSLPPCAVPALSPDHARAREALCGRG